ncbi:MAG: flagellar biosynthesis protein FliQ [Chloroflexi bacterium]|nr:flagellar biosynthesis protein FliQ [Chloroflexota bacterium]
MTLATAMELTQGALSTTLLLLAPLLASALLVGLAVSLFQAVTQLNELTLTFVPKLLVLAGVLVALGPWMLTTLLDYSVRLFALMPYMVR